MAQIQTYRQISVFLENSPGHLQKVCGILAEAGVSIQTISLAEAKDYGMLRMIVDDVDKALDALKAADIFAKVIEVLGVEVPDEAGALYKILKRTSDAGINVEYMYANTKGCNGNPIMIIRFEDLEKAKEILEGEFGA